jgi:hypothetical protein
MNTLVSCVHALRLRRFVVDRNLLGKMCCQNELDYVKQLYLFVIVWTYYTELVVNAPNCALHSRARR